jgi:hypothetical protein
MSPAAHRAKRRQTSPSGLHRRTPGRCLLLVLACLAALSVSGQEETPFTRLFDTGVAAAEPLANEVPAQRAGWSLVPEDKVDHQFSGDAVLSNDKLTVVLRKRGGGAEVYSKAASRRVHRATIGPARGESSMLEARAALKIIENNSGAVAVEAASQGGGPAGLRLRLTTGEAILEIRSDDGLKSVNVLTRARHVVVPDYFGDDMVYGTVAPLTPALSPSAGERVPEGWVRGQRLSSESQSSSLAAASPRLNLYLPAENFCLNLLDGGDAIVMCVWQSSQQEVWLAGAQAAKETGFLSSAIQCLKGKRIWLAFLESPGIWHAGSVSAKDDWKPPFPAKWRCDLVRENGVADSWDRDAGPRPEQVGARQQGLLVIYPIDRSAATPLTAICPTDVMRNTLGVGPCQYILAVEGMTAQGDPTPNSVMNWVERQFALKKDKQTAEDINERFDQMTRHVGEARARIERYGQGADQLRKLLASQPRSEPFGPMVGDLDRFAAAGLAPTASPERARQLAAGVSALIGKDNGLASCRRLGEQLRSIGALQDTTLAKCRMAVRRLKQEARAMAVNQPEAAALAREVQRLADQILQNK